MANWVHPLTGGYVTLACWRDDIGVIPTTAYFTIPGLGVNDKRPAAIMRDGYVRGRLNPADIPAGSNGDFQVVWYLTAAIDGLVLTDDHEPIVDEIVTLETLTITTDPVLLDVKRLYKDEHGYPTPKYIREKQLFGIPPFDANNRLLTDAAFQNAIEAAILRVENELGIVLRPRMCAGTDGATNPNNLPYLDEPGYDYDPAKFRAFSYLRLRHHPIRTVYSVELWVGAQRVTTIPPEWLRINKKIGDVQVLPNALNTLAIGLGGIAFPLLRAGSAGSSIPHLWRVNYEAGMEADPGIFEVVSWIAAAQLLIIIASAVDAGIASQSVSVDGISESVSTTASAENSLYGANITEVTKRIKEWFEHSGPSYSGVRMMVL